MLSLNSLSAFTQEVTRNAGIQPVRGRTGRMPRAAPRRSRSASCKARHRWAAPRQRAATCRAGRCSTCESEKSRPCHFARRFRNLSLRRPRRADNDSVMSRFVRRIPEGDDHERLICADCGHVSMRTRRSSSVPSSPRVIVSRCAGAPSNTPRLLDHPRRLHGDGRDRRGRRAARGLGGGACPHHARGRAGGLFDRPAGPGAGHLPRPLRGTRLRAGAREPRSAPFHLGEIPWDEIAFPRSAGRSRPGGRFGRRRRTQPGRGPAGVRRCPGGAA